MAKREFGRTMSIRGSLGAVLCALGLLGCLTLLAPRGASAALTAEQKTLISANLAANKSYTEIITSAVAAGMPAEDIVAFLIQSRGAAPGAVYEIVYAAIMAGCDAGKVIGSALTCGADLQTVFNAANAAGVSRDKIFAGALGAGYSQSQIADSYADVSVTGGARESNIYVGGKERPGVASPSHPK